MPNVVVDQTTGNVLVVHRRTLGIASALFIVAMFSFILAKYTEGEPSSESFLSLGLLCCILLIFVLIWRCCRCCCVTRAESTGYIVVQNSSVNVNAPNPQTYPIQPPSVPVIPVFQPATNPNFAPPGTMFTEAPPSYADAVTIPVKY